jgi:SLT domain-containing protein
MNEVEYILRIVLKARDELATALRKAREELRLFANSAESNQKKIDAFNKSIETMDKNVTNITNKFREWRAVIEGAGKDNEDAGKSFGQLGREVDQTTRKTVTAAKTTKELAQEAGRLRKEYQDLAKAHKEERVEQDYAISNFQKIGRELEKLSGKLRSGTRDSQRYWDWAKDAKGAADSIKRAQEEITRAQAEELKKRIAAEDAALKFGEKMERDSFARRARERESLVKTYNTLISKGLEAQIADEERAAKESLRIEEETARRRQSIRDRDTRALALHARAREAYTKMASGDFTHVDSDEARRTVTELKKIATAYDENSKSARRLRTEASNLSHALRDLGRDGEKTDGLFRTLNKTFRSNHESIAALDNQLRGMGLLLIVGFAQQLITVLTGLAGAFVSVGSSAAMAGSAIGGMFVAGIAQALPSIGLLGAALVRVKGVMDAVNQAQLAQQQGAVQAATAGRRMADANDSVRKAQEALNKARKDARRDLQDLMLAEKQAELAARGAVMSQAEAQDALRQAIASGDVDAVGRAQLDVLNAQVDVEDKLLKARRARADAGTARRQGPEGMPGVTQAAEQLETAKRNAQEAAEGTETAVAKLNFLLAQLSPAERRLYTAITNIQRLFREGVYRDITDNLINSFARSVEKITDIIQMPKVIREAQKTSQTLARTLNKIFDAFTTKPMLDQFLRIAEAGRKNLAPLARIVTNLGKAFVNIAEEAGPSFRRFLNFVSDLVDKFLDLTRNRKGMTEFFEEGEKHFEAWIKLGVAVIRLFAAITGAGGAESGLKTIEDATKAIDDLTAKVKDNASNVGQFFEDSRKTLYEVVGVVSDLAKALFEVWTPERVHNFAILLRRVIIPALTDIISFLGDITQKLVEFAETPFGERFLKAVVVFVVLNRVVSGVLGSLRLLGGATRLFAELIGDVAKYFGLLENATKFLRPLMAFFEGGGGVRLVAGGGIVGAVLLLLQALGLLDDAWREVKKAFDAFWKEVEPSLKQLFKSFRDLWKAVSNGEGALGAVLDILRPIVKVIIQFAGIVLQVFGRTVGRIFSGFIDMLSGFIDIITGLLTGDWGKAWDGFKRIIRGAVRAATAIVRFIPELIWEIIKRIPGLFRKLGPLLLDAIKWAFAKLWDFLERLPGRLERLGERAAKAFVNAFKNVGESIIKGILGGLTHLGGFARDIANAFIDLLNQLLPNKISIPGAPDINLPDDPIPHLATGGYIHGDYRKGDKYTVKVAGEEVILNPQQQSLIGKGRIMDVLRSTGAQFLHPGGAFAEGAQPAAAGSLTVTFVSGGMDDFTARWRQFWVMVVAIARSGTNAVEAYFRDMRVKTQRTMDRMERDIEESLLKLTADFNTAGRRIVRSWAQTWQSMMDITHKALFYIGHETNQALRGLGEKGINFGFTEPQKGNGKAGGGWIEGQGHRGRDMGLYPLGAGEAVLNWQHQRYVEPAMNAYYGHGLNAMFRRVRGYHAGGPGQMGFAGGRSGDASIFDGHPSNVVSAIRSLIILMKKKFPGLVVSSTTDHSRLTTSGNVSDHTTGNAVDLASGDYGLMNRAAAYVLSSGLYKQLKQGIHNPNLAVNRGQKMTPPGIFAGAVWAQHANHLHLAMVGALRNVANMISSVMRTVVTGPDGGLKTIMQAALDKVRKLANEFIDNKSAMTTDDAGMPPTPGEPAPKGLHRRWIIAGLRLAGIPATEANIAAQYILDMGESSGNPKAVQQIHDINSVTGNLARGIAQVIPPTFASYHVEGHNDIMNPVDNIAASARYQIARYGHLVGHPGYAKGGEIPGPLGKAVPILAHAQEWVVNPLQQARLAMLTGLSRAGLKSMLGFYGGKGSFAGGGDPLRGEERKAAMPFTTEAERKRLRDIARGIYELPAFAVDTWAGLLREASRVFSAMRAKHANAERRLKAFEALTKEGGIIDQMDQSRERYSAALTRNLTFAAYHFNRATRRVTQGRLDTNVEVSTRELANARKEMQEILGEEGFINKAMKRVNARIKKLKDDGVKLSESPELQKLTAQRNALRDQFASIRDAHAQALEKIFQAQVARQQAIVDEISARYEKESGGRELFRRVAEALGDEGAIAKLNAAQRDMLTRQANELEGRINAARRAGAGDLADQLASQVADLRVQIFESLQQDMRDAVDRINTRASRSLGRLDIANRMLDALGAVGLGSVAGGVGLSRAQVFQSRGDTLAGQRRDLQAVLVQAQQAPLGQRNLALIDELTDQLADLDATIQENTKAYFDARLEDVNNRAGFSLNINDLNKQITELEGTISGNTDQAKIVALLQERANILNQQRLELEALLAEAQKAGNQQEINDLTQALLENRIAILQNTQATNEATGALTQPQTFTSSAWTRFREAIFNGMGQVLPQYNPQNMMGEINTGAVVIPAGGGTSRVSGDTNINLYEAGRPVDLQEVSAAVTFASKTSQ